MALITCKDCGNAFSTDAKKCPSCGAKKPPQPVKQWPLGQMFLWIFGLIVLAAVLDAHMKSMMPPKSEAEIKSEKSRDLELNVSYYCQEQVRKQLHDPDSAEFDYPATYHVTNKNGDYTVDVTLRARNGFNALRKLTMQCRVLADSSGKVMLIGLKEVQH